MDKLHVRVYNVHFGDAILISVPETDPHGVVTVKHILIDMGNAASGLGEGGSDEVFQPVVEDILNELKGTPLDLYIMTHEHLDHVQGLLYAFKKLNKTLPVDYAWFTASAAPDYYAKHPMARKKKQALDQAFAQIESFFNAAPQCFGDAREQALFHNLMLNNNPQSTEDCVDYLRKLTGDATRNTYVYRDCNLAGKHTFGEAQFHIWAPEQDTAAYYHKLHPMALAALPSEYTETTMTTAVPIPPAGVDASAFFALVQARRQGYADNLMTIDRAANNTSVVFSLQWRGWTLLFSGDAEQASWQMMEEHHKLESVHFLKVSHHGSINGTPPIKLLDKVLPKNPPDHRPRRAAVSTWKDTYPGVPDAETLDEIRSRCELKSTLDDLDAQKGEFYLDYEFEG